MTTGLIEYSVAGWRGRVHQRDLSQWQKDVCKKLPQILAGAASTSYWIEPCATDVNRAWLEIRCDGLSMRLSLTR